MKKILLAFLITAGAFGAISADKQYKLNQYLGSVGSQTQLGTLIAEGGQTGYSRDGHQSAQLLIATYDFAVNGGASGASIHLGVSLPSKAIIRRTYLDTVTPVASSGASIEISALNRGDIKNPFLASILNVADQQTDGYSTGTVGLMKKITSATPRGIFFGINAGTITAGKVKIFIEYVVSQ